MIFTCDKTAIQDACTIASRAASAKSPIEALEGLLISAQNGRIRITGYDLRKAIYTDIEAEVSESGSTVVNTRFFVEMLRRMPDGTLSFSSDMRNKIKCTCGKSDYDFMGLDASEYPEMPQFNEINSVDLPQDILGSMIRQTIFAVSKDEARPVYTGTLFEIIDGTLTLVSLDGHRLARRCEKIENSVINDCTFIVPGFSLSDLEKVCDDTNNPVRISIGDKHISFTVGKTVIISRRLEGEFLNHRNTVPESFKYIITVNRQEIISVIDRVVLMQSEKNENPVKMVFNDGRIDCLCSTPLGKAEDVCFCEGSGEGMETGFNGRLFLEALKATDTEKLHLCLNKSISPCVIKDSDDSEKFTFMVLPVRIRAGA